MKKLFAIGLALVIMMFTLVGCGAGERVTTIIVGDSKVERHYVDDVLVKEINSVDGVIQSVTEYTEDGYLLKEVVIGDEFDTIRDYDEYGVVTETERPHINDDIE